jgi:hypothetical protein
MTTLISKQVPPEYVEFLDKWRKGQKPPLNRQQAIVKMIGDFIEQNRTEFERLGYIPKKRKYQR